MDKKPVATGLFKGSLFDKWFRYRPKQWVSLEIAAGDREHAARILEIMGIFGIEAKTIERKHNFVVYMKEGAAIVDF